MTKSKLVHEFRIYLYADGTSAYRVLEHTEPKRARRLPHHAYPPLPADGRYYTKKQA